MFNKQKPGKKGFSLLEIIVAVGIFGMIVLISVGSILSVVGANQKARAMKSVMSNLNFAIDTMARDLRMGTSYDCGTVGSPVDCKDTGSSTMNFKAVDGSSVSYSLSDGAIIKTVNSGQSIPLTADEITVENMKFYVVGADLDDNLQPRILLIIQGVASPASQAETNFNIQTTISQRSFDKQN